MTRVPLTPPAHLPRTLGALRTAEPGSAAPQPSRSRSATTCSPRCAPGATRGRASSASSPPCCRSSSARCSPGTTSCCSASAARARPACCAPWSACSTSGRPSSPAPSWASTRSRRSPRPRCRRAAELGDDLPVAWRHRDERYTEKLATPDTAVADLIGDVDPVKVAEGRSLGDPETIHYGLVPRAHRGIVAINELPDLAERIQVALLNVMEERDIQVRGYTLRLPLDVLLVASANPEDYTNRGRIITPLKDRFGAEVRTHYPLELADELAVMDQEAELVAAVPAFLLEILARFTRSLRESSAVDQGSGVSARFSVAAAETVAAAALRRAAIAGESRPTARPIDLESVPDVLRGKLEFASGEEGREAETLTHLLRRATADAARARLRGLDLTPLAEAVAQSPVRTGERVPAPEVVVGAAAHAGADRGRPAARRGRHRGPGPDGRRGRAGAGVPVPHPEAGQGRVRRRDGALRMTPHANVINRWRHDTRRARRG